MAPRQRFERRLIAPSFNQHHGTCVGADGQRVCCRGDSWSTATARRPFDGCQVESLLVVHLPSLAAHTHLTTTGGPSDPVRPLSGDRRPRLTGKGSGGVRRCVTPDRDHRRANCRCEPLALWDTATRSAVQALREMVDVAWNLLPAGVRSAYRTALQVDDATWARGRGWALTVALIQLPSYRDTNPVLAANADT